MINIMIIDDEPFVTLGLAKLLSCGDYSVKTFNNVKPALDYAKSDARLDIVISDVQMPNMSGIDLCFEIRKYQDVEIIIISGHQSFEYAKRSIELNALRYILKPINQNEFLSVVNDAAGCVYKRKELQVADSRKNGYLLSKYLIDRANGLNVTDQNELERTIEARADFSRYCVCILAAPALISAANELRQNYFSEIRRYLKNAFTKIPWNLCEFEHGRYILLLHTGRAKCMTLLKDLLCYSQKKLEQYVILTLSEEHTSLAQISCAIEESTRAFYCFTLQSTPMSIVPYDSSMAAGKEKNSQLNVMRFQFYVGKALDHIMNENARQLESLLDQLFLEIQALELSAECARHECRNLLLCVHYEAAKLLTGEEKSIHDFIPQPEPDLACDFTFPNLKSSLLAALTALIDYVHEIHGSKNENVIATIDHLLQKNCREVTLQYAAVYIGVHPSYLSVIFKEKSGKNFKDYVLDYKMDLAKKRLGNKNIKIYQIAEEVGYADIDHFSRVFKKRFHVTPSEYRNTLYSSRPGL